MTETPWPAKIDRPGAWATRDEEEWQRVGDVGTSITISRGGYSGGWTVRVAEDAWRALGLEVPSSAPLRLVCITIKHRVFIVGRSDERLDDLEFDVRRDLEERDDAIVDDVDSYRVHYLSPDRAGKIVPIGLNDGRSVAQLIADGELRLEGK